MRLPLSWLRDFVDVSVSPEDLAERLITAGFEVERVLRLGAPDQATNHGNFVIGRVAHFEQHPNADRLRLCRVETGDAEPRQIVCGASNFQIGDTVVVALPGALLPGAEKPLKQAKLRGETSDGMMLSERELGLSDEHEGIIVLPDPSGFEIGSPLADHIALEEVVLDLAVESNRGDCLSVYGLAREVAVLYGLDLAPMPGVLPQASATGTTADLVTVAIDATARCSRFTAHGFVDVTVGPSPFRIRQRLAAAGIRPILNVVDVTNYVMHELGNPLHAYDADKVPGQFLTARMAEDGERLVTLDGKERVLTSDMLVIADADGPSGIAGVMGGAASEITVATTRVVLESACFERSGIQRTSAALGLRTDGSNRWEKGVNPHLAPLAATRAAELIVDWAGGTMLADPQDVHGALPEPERIHLRSARADAVLGMTVPNDQATRVLDGLGFAPTPTDDGWDCIVPFWRWLDTTREIDLVEEIGRIWGLDHVPTEIPRLDATRAGLSRSQALTRRIAAHLTGAGLREATTVSLTDPEVRARYRATDSALVLRNPLSSDLSEMRTSLLPGLVEVLRANRAVGTDDLALFEIGRSYRGGGEHGLAIETPHLAIVIAGQFGGDSWLGEGIPADTSALVALLDGLSSRLGVDLCRRPVADVPLLHPGRAFALEVDGLRIGAGGELHPGLAREFELDGPVALAEVDLTALITAVPERQAFQGLSIFPPVRQDIALLVSSDIDAAALLATAYTAGGALLHEAGVFDVFEDPERLGAGRRSIAIRLSFQAPDRTLTEEEASDVRERIVAALVERHAAELRT